MGFLELSNYGCLPGKAGGSPSFTRIYGQAYEPIGALSRTQTNFVAALNRGY
jgi:hypothetical protein